MRHWSWTLACAVLLLSASAVHAWHGRGHYLATRTAVAALPKELPAFFREEVDSIAHCSPDPDLLRKPLAGPQLHAAGAADHYFDLELLKDEKPPIDRMAFLKWCFEKKINPSHIGLAPYAVAEGVQRLEVAFAEHRRWPDNVHIQIKCVVYAGLLAHYAQDLCQPLHCTVDYDGRAGEDGKVPHSGIHARLDAVLQKVAVDPKKLGPTLKPAAFEDTFAAAIQQARKSNALVDRVYELDKQIPAVEAPLDRKSDAAEFARGRLGECATFTASLYMTAWRNSAKIQFPKWHDLSDMDGDGELGRPCAAPATKPAATPASKPGASSGPDRSRSPAESKDRPVLRRDQQAAAARRQAVPARDARKRKLAELPAVGRREDP